MDNKKGLIIVVLILFFAAVISNIITAQYISYKLENKIRMEMEDISRQITQIQRQNQSSNTINREEKWNEVMAPTELAQYLDIELNQVYDIIENKESGIPYVCIDGAYRFSKDAINQWLASQKNIVINSIR